jgi:cytochrome oxidase Cu insertion factor (SCO1/SenC/PrrC family)
VPGPSRTWLKPALIAIAAVVGAGIGVGIAIARGSPSGHSSPAAAPSDPGISWPAGVRPAPNFVLRGENGAPVDLRSFRGRPVIVAFIDPVCRNLCPLEAKVLNDVPAAFPAASRPAIVAVSVNPWNQSTSDLRLDAQKWHLTPGWRWALGGHAQLASVWKRYAIGVQVHTKTLAGVTVHEVDHTEAAYVIDPAGDERAVFVFPYRTEDVVRTLRLLTPRSSSSQR